MNRPREPIMRAFKALFLNIPEFNLVTRRLRGSADFNRTDMPVLMIDEPNEAVNQANDATPSATTINVELWLFLNNGQDPNCEPIVALNGLLDKVDSGLAPDNPISQKLTLGGLVTHCLINGRIEKNAGDIGGIGIAKIPVQILVP